VSGFATSDVEVISTADKNGLPNTRLRLNGTPTGNVLILMPNLSPSSPAAANGQTWASSAYVQMVAGSLANITQSRLAINAFNASNAFVAGYTSAGFDGTISSDLRRSFSATLSGATIARIVPYLIFSWTSGAIDITIDISAPQLELGSEATAVQITGASGLDVTEAGRRNV
jgi:hypothetical protein